MADGSGRLAGKVAVITGASRGIGEAIADAYARQGADLVLASRTMDELEAVAARAAETGVRAVPIQVDVTHDAGVTTLAERTHQEFGRCDVLVNNAGLYAPGRFEDHSVDTFQQVMDVNFFGIVRTIHAFLPKMREQGAGAIVNVASTAGKYGSLFQSPYNSSKHAVVGLTRCLALETAKQGIRVNAICPGFVDTPMVQSALPRFAEIFGVPEEEILPVLLQRVPMGRLIEPEEVADLAVYLGSDESRGMTGIPVTLAGGLILI
jgi:3-hydroxybutyrate dehydrogenase